MMSYSPQIYIHSYQQIFSCKECLQDSYVYAAA
jgi:hypothetical protein